jgi:hypothetical protein
VFADVCHGFFASVQPLKPQSPGSKWPAWNSSHQFIAIQPSSMDIFTDLAQYAIRVRNRKQVLRRAPPDFPLGNLLKDFSWIEDQSLEASVN